MIKEIQIIAGGLTLAKYSGEYLHCLAHRDLTKTKKEIFDRMIGHVPEMYDPANGIGLNNSSNALSINAVFLNISYSKLSSSNENSLNLK